MGAAEKPLILTYHSVSMGRPPLAISPSLFAEQMEWLSQNARVVPLGAITDPLKHHQPLPAQTVVLTFDDGYRDFYTDAAPHLRRHGFPATVFLPTAYCGQTNSWSGQPSWVEEQSLLTWQQIKELAEQGVHFGPHTVTHRELTSLSVQDAQQEIVESKREVEAKTGQAAEFFCYPYGRWNLTVRDLVAGRFSGACSTGAAAVGPDADPFALPRVDAHYLRTPVCFRSLFTRRLLGYLGLRRNLRRLRNQPEGMYSKL
ncbi:MAG: polysaccharide deacetylase family protein [Candidatus Acidiferrales bacterium]|jgi:peptidoglycan/xylan/chitin deacetylase (PgdA/CDA1 family)